MKHQGNIFVNLLILFIYGFFIYFEICVISTATMCDIYIFWNMCDIYCNYYDSTNVFRKFSSEKQMKKWLSEWFTQKYQEQESPGKNMIKCTVNEKYKP